MDESGGDGSAPEAVKIAEALGTDPFWVQRCAQTYGRKVSVPRGVEDVGPEDRSERWESQEAEEVGPEEKEARGETYEGEVPDEKRRPKRFGEDAVEWEPFMQKPWDADMQNDWQPTLLDDDL
jgi:hypothetical protein